MAKRVFYDDDARARVLGGAQALYDAVKVTYGPKGRNVVIAKGYGGPTVTHDGVTVAEAVDALEARWPGMRDRICDSRPAIRRHMNVFVDGRRVKLDGALRPGADVFILTAVSGG